ncbi:MAG: protein kinase [candidate division Zixibacteria bacterium]|nr:protein kinase [candidate division Zixibacteria bacterium]
MPDSDSNDITRSHVQLAPGSIIGHYRIIERIGAGGMGEVYLAEDTQLNRRVALKFLPPHLCQDADCRARFKREAQAIAKLNHPNIVTIHDVNEHLGRPYIVMEHVEGQSLHYFTHDKPLPIGTIVDYAIQICQGIGEAHRAGVIHRDIKAANIVLDAKGRVRLLDFGLAAVAGDERLTRTGSTLGTVAYMSPEQVTGRDIDHRSDLFSLGIVLYELIAARTPFHRDNEGATLRAITQDIPEPLSRYKADVPVRLQQIIDKLLEKDKELRYQTAEDVIADLKRLLYDSQPTGFRRPPAPTKSRWKLVAGIAAVIAVIVAAGIYLTRSKSTHRAAEGGGPVIAVLPFENLGNPEDEYFADGMAEEITSRLAGIKGLGVISRTSAMQYKRSEKTLKQIGKELGVTHVLEGSVRWARAGGKSRVRITPQLIRVSDDRHLWADNYEREMMDVFAVQEDIATKIVDQMGLTLLDANRAALASRPTTSSEAYDYYLKGISGVRRFDWSLQTVTAAAANLDSAVMIDPAFALAYAARSRAYTSLSFISPSPMFKTVARESFGKALELQPNLSYGHMAAGIYYNLVEDDYGQALTELSRAASELHNDADLIAAIAFVQFRQGKFAEAAENFQKAAEFDPLNPAVHASRSEFFRFSRMYQEAEQSINRAIALDPKRADYYLEKLFGYVSRYGDWGRVREVAREALTGADTLEFAYRFMSLSAYSNGLSADSLLAETNADFKTMVGRIRSEYRSKLAPDMYYCILSGWYGYAGDAILKSVYADSARTSLEKWLQDAPDDWQRVSMLSVLFLKMGRCEPAVELGIRAKELLSIAKCHW